MYLFGLMALTIGGLITYVAEVRTHSAVHEIEALLCFVVGVLGLGFAAVIDKLEQRLTK